MSAKTKAPRVFVPLTKVDEAQRLVYGRITQEMLDKSAEVMDYDSSKPLFEKWSNEIHEASGGLSKGNVRVMHGLTAAGKLTELDFNDLEKAIDVCAKIVDDVEWNKVTEGVYTGFSVGGSYAKRWTDTVDGEKIKKFTANPNEVSIVDNPCVPSATFSMFKADGSQTTIAFKVENDDDTWPGFAKAEGSENPPAKEEPDPNQLEIPLPSNDEIVAQAEKIAKAAGDGTTWMQHVEAAREELMQKRDFSAKERKTAADKGTAMSDGSFPIENEEDLHNAIRLAGNAKDPAAARKHIMERAKAMGMENAIPDDWKTDEKSEKVAKAAPKSGGKKDISGDAKTSSTDDNTDATTDPVDEDDEGADGNGGEGVDETGDKKSKKVTPSGVKQVWTSSDGQTFEKKDDAIKHEATLTKAELTEAEKLKARLQKALAPDPVIETPPLMEDFDRLGKVIQVLETPFEPEKLAKGMYTVSRFAQTLWDLGSLIRKIAAEGKQEGDDKSDANVSDSMKKALGTLCDSFKGYVDNQLTELMAGMDDDVCVEVYDYYYAAVKADPENQLAKDVCEVLTERRDPSREVRETLTKAFGIASLTPEPDDGMNPSLQKRFDKLEAENAEFKKIAEDAVGEVEKLTKRVEQIEETPLPRAPRNIAFREGDQEFFGKRVTNDVEKVAVLKEMIELHGADGLATMMIKAAHAQGGQKLTLNR